MTELNGKTFVLIAGQPKAGTTSLFDWLSQHPKVGVGKLKELRFFLDPQYPLKSADRFNDDRDLGAYLKLFNHSDRPVLLDATPDYIGCEVPLKFPSLHPKAKAVIILRDPIERMISAYRFFRARALIPAEMSFNEYVKKQYSEEVVASTPVQYRALDHCRVNYYVPRWQKAYGDNLLLIDFEDLKNDPQQIVEEVCYFIGLQPEGQIDASHKNRTQTYRYPGVYRMYCSVRLWLGIKTLRFPLLYKVIRPFGRFVENRLKVHGESSEEICVSEEVRAIILETEAGG